MLLVSLCGSRFRIPASAYVQQTLMQATCRLPACLQPMAPVRWTSRSLLLQLLKQGRNVPPPGPCLERNVWLLNDIQLTHPLIQNTNQSLTRQNGCMMEQAVPTSLHGGDATACTAKAVIPSSKQSLGLSQRQRSMSRSMRQ